MAKEQSVAQNPKPASSPETAKTIMKIGLLVGIVLIVAGGLLLFLNLTGNPTPTFISTNGRRPYTGLVQGGVLTVVGLAIIVIMVIGLTGNSDEESTSISP